MIGKASGRSRRLDQHDCDHALTYAYSTPFLYITLIVNGSTYITVIMYVAPTVLCTKCKRANNSSIVMCTKAEALRICIDPSKVDDLTTIQREDGTIAATVGRAMNHVTISGLCQGECPSPKVVPVQGVPILQ